MTPENDVPPGSAAAAPGDDPTNARIDAAEAAGPHAGGGGDDPLDFGDQRMPGDASDADADAVANGADDSIESLREQLAAAEARADENWDRLLRLQAEMENQRKRSQKDVANAKKFSVEAIVLDLLPVKDSLEMGITAARAEDADLASILEGSELTLKMLSQAFEKHQIAEIDPLDQKFDPDFHQAMSMQPVEGKESNTVSSVMQKGYTLNERLIRPALVIVAK